jgi:hypothetical protein
MVHGFGALTQALIGARTNSAVTPPPAGGNSRAFLRYVTAGPGDGDGRA